MNEKTSEKKEKPATGTFGARKWGREGEMGRVFTVKGEPELKKGKRRGRISSAILWGRGSFFRYARERSGGRVESQECM